MSTAARILLVEDDQTIAELYKLKLEMAGYSVRIAENGKTALDIISEFHPQLLLLDLLMPIMSGEKFLEKLRADTEHKDLPVIVLTNISREEAPKTLWHYGISTYFVKAHNTPAELVAAIQKELTA